MKRTPAHQGGADSPQLDAVAGHQLGDGMFASKSLGVDTHLGVGQARAAARSGHDAVMPRDLRSTRSIMLGGNAIRNRDGRRGSRRPTPVSAGSRRAWQYTRYMSTCERENATYASRLSSSS